MDEQHRRGHPGDSPTEARSEIRDGSLLFLGEVRTSIGDSEVGTETAPIYAVLIGRDPRDVQRWVAVPADDVPVEPDADLFLAPTSDPSEVGGLWARLPLAFTIADGVARTREVCGRVGAEHVRQLANLVTDADQDWGDDLALADDTYGASEFLDQVEGGEEFDLASSTAVKSEQSFETRERLLDAIADLLSDADRRAKLSSELRSIWREVWATAVASESKVPVTGPISGAEQRYAAEDPADAESSDRLFQTLDGRRFRLRFDPAGRRVTLIPDIVDDVVDVTIGGQAAEVRPYGYRGPLIYDGVVAVARCVLRTSLGWTVVLTARHG
jgi:hypothetical protein